MKKNILILLISILMIPTIVNGLEFKSEEKFYGGNNNDYFYQIYPTNDGGWIATGGIKSTNISGITISGNEDAIIVKYDKDGNIEWQKNYGGNLVDSYNRGIALSDGSYVGVGTTSSTNISEMSSSKKYDALIVKHDKDGNVLWSRNYGGTQQEMFTSVIETSDGGIVAQGITYLSYISSDTNDQKGDIITVKYDKDGNLLWETNYTTDLDENIYDAIENSNGEIITIGYTKSSINGKINKGGRDAIILKRNKDGELLDVITFGGTGDDEINGIKQTSDGGYIVAADSASTDIEGFTNAGNSDALLIKYDKDFNIEWQKSYGESGDELFESVIITNNSQYIAIGYSTSSTINGLTSNGNFDTIVVCYDTNGNIEWQKNFGGNNIDFLGRIISLGSNEYVLAGYTYSTKIGNSTSNGNIDGIIIKLLIQYDVEVTDSKNGTFTQNVENNKLKIIPKPEEGYELDEIIITDINGNKLNYYEENGTYYSDINNDVTVEVKFKEKKLLDIINPETGDFKSLISLLILIVTLITTGILIKNKKQTN